MRLENSKILDATYKLLGMCAHLCANIEYGICLLLVLHRWEQKHPHLKRLADNAKRRAHDLDGWQTSMKNLDIGLDEVQKQIENLYKCSLERLIHQMQAAFPMEPEQIKYLKEIKDKRNYVIHTIWGKYGRRLQDPLVVNEMFNELREYELYFRKASNWIFAPTKKVEERLEKRKEKK